MILPIQPSHYHRFILIGRRLNAYVYFFLMSRPNTSNVFAVRMSEYRITDIIWIFIALRGAKTSYTCSQKNK